MSKKINVLIVFLFSVGSLFSQTLCSDFKLTDFKINGNTTLTNNEATLTLALNNQSGSIWSNQKIDLSKDFTINADLNFGILDDDGADGIAFVIQPLSSDIGTLGGGIGYQGITPSLAIEFDTYFNVGWDPVSSDHIAIIKNGKTNDLTSHSEFVSFKSLNNIEDGLWHEVIFEWKASTKKLKVTFDNNIQIDTTIDLINSIFTGNKDVYWGFTAATGGSINVQKVRLKNYCVTLETCSAIPGITSSDTTICANQSVKLEIAYTPAAICNMDITPTTIPLGNPIPGFSYGGLYNGHHYYIYNNPTTWTAGELISRQNGGYLVCINDINENQFVSNLTNNNIWIGLFRDPSTCQFRWLDCMDITFTNWRSDEPNNGPCGEPYTQIIRGCSNGLNTWNNLNDNSTNGSCYSDMVPIMEIDPTIYNSGPINTTTTYLWSTGATTPTINVTPSETTTYWVDVTTNGNTCRKSITITVNKPIAPTGATNQKFCNSKTIADLVANGTGILWYATASSTTPLNNTLLLSNGSHYFASQTINGCESSSRFETTVSIIIVPNSFGESKQTLCIENEPSIKNIVVNDANTQWYNAPVNGNLLNNTTLLQDNNTYYAASIDTVSGCESSDRLAVTITLLKCDLIVFNSVKINASPMSDRLFVDDISYFTDNNMKIYNRYGKLVWETNGYNNATNAFKGKANVPDLFQKDEQLPAGTYFYILNYFNFIDRTQKEKNGYLQLFNGN